jgi:hypothetical protein
LGKRFAANPRTYIGGIGLGRIVQPAAVVPAQTTIANAADLV